MRLIAGIVTAAVMACGASTHAEAPPPSSPISAFVAEAAQQTDIPEAWIWSVMRVESAGNMRAISRAGAMGLMQLMPATWSDLRARLRLGNDPFDPHDNVIAGAFFLRAMHDRYGEPGFLAAYNAGPGRYEDYLYRHRPLPAETTAYLARLAPAVSRATLPDPTSWMRAGLFVGAAIDKTSPAPPSSENKPTSGQPADISPANPLFIRTANAAQR